MNRCKLNVCILIMTICIVSSSIISEGHDTDLNETVKAIVEKLLQEKKINENIKISGGNLQNKVDDLEKKIELMNARLEEQDKTIDILKNVIQKISGEVIGEYNVKSTDEKLDTIRHTDEVGDMEVNKRFIPGRRVKRAVGNIAFSAYLTHTNSHTVVGQPIKFDQVLINDGHGYNKYTGAFTAPLSGVYLFNFAIDTRKLTFVRLVIDGVNQVDAVANVHTNAESRHSQSMGGNTAIVHVGHGQSVLVETYEIPDAETASSNTFRLCTFSGVLLY